MKTLDLLSSKIKDSFLKYSLGLVLTKGKKTCPKMAVAMSICHDLLYRFLLKTSSFLHNLSLRVKRLYKKKLGRG